MWIRVEVMLYGICRVYSSHSRVVDYFLDGDQLFPLESRSALLPGTSVSLGIIVHQALGWIWQERCREGRLFERMRESVNTDPVLLIKLLAVLPLRLFAAYQQAQCGMFVRNSTHLTTVRSELKFRENAYCRLLPLFIFI
jgi:hypothetical protein